MHSNSFRDQPAHFGKNQTARIRLTEHLRPDGSAIDESSFGKLGDIALNRSGAGPYMPRDLTEIKRLLRMPVQQGKDAATNLPEQNF